VHFRCLPPLNLNSARVREGDDNLYFCVSRETASRETFR
jgi:hypothetical protein